MTLHQNNRDNSQILMLCERSQAKRNTCYKISIYKSLESAG